MIRPAHWYAGWLAAAIFCAVATPLAAEEPAKSKAAAAPQLGNPNDSQPIEIRADSGIEWQQTTKSYIARGHAVAIRGPTEINADTLIAHYREVKGANPGNAAGNTEIYRLDAEGNVIIRKEGETITGDRAVYDVDQAVGVVTGKNLKMTTATDTITARDRFDWYDQKQIGVARGDAVAIRNGKTIRADVLTGYMVKTPAAPAKPGEKPKPVPTPAAAKPAAAKGTPGADDSKLSRVDAQGHVVVTNGSDVGQSDYGVYNAQSGIVTLIGNAVITRDKDVIRGQYAVMDLNTNVSRMMPSSAGEPGQHQQVRGLFVRRDPNTGKPATIIAPSASTSAPTGTPTAPSPQKAQ